MYRQYGFVVPRSGLVNTADEAVGVSSEIGFPVALKIASPDILHRTDVGGVELNLGTPDSVRLAFERVREAALAARPEARIEGMEVQEMVTGGTEIIIGLLDDPQFGPVVMFGLGGVFTEVLGDVSFRVVPIERRDAAQMIREPQGYEVLRGYRGQRPVSEEMLIDLLMNASRMAMDLAGRLESVDFNPVVVWEDQHRVLDAKVLWKTDAQPSPVTPPVNVRHLGNFFGANSVALIGASATPGKVGNAVLDSLLNHDYQGKVYPVNPGRSEVMGAKSYPSLSEVPDRIDLAVVTIDGRHGYVDVAGHLAIDPQFDNARPFSGGLAAVATESECGYIDPSGDYVWRRSIEGNDRPRAPEDAVSTNNDTQPVRQSCAPHDIRNHRRDEPLPCYLVRGPLKRAGLPCPPTVAVLD